MTKGWVGIRNGIENYDSCAALAAFTDLHKVVVKLMPYREWEISCSMDVQRFLKYLV